MTGRRAAIRVGLVLTPCQEGHPCDCATSQLSCSPFSLSVGLRRHRRPNRPRSSSLTSAPWVGTPPFALDINNRGQVTGNSRTEGGQLVAFLWERGRMTNLGFLPGGNGFSRGYAVNDRGAVVGESDNNRPRAFLCERGELSDVGTLAGGSTAVAHDVNNAARIPDHTGDDGRLLRAGTADRGVQVGEYRQDLPVVLWFREQVELGEDAGDVGLLCLRVEGRAAGPTPRSTGPGA